MAVSKARTDEHIHKYYITQNGVIKVRRTADKEDSYIAFSLSAESHLYQIQLAHIDFLQRSQTYSAWVTFACDYLNNQQKYKKQR